MDGARVGGGNGPIQFPESLLRRITEGLESVKPRSSSWSIFTVPNKLRNLNADAYTPHILSIGPYHQDLSNVAGLQSHKWRYTLSLLDRTEDASPTMEACLKAVLGFESEVRSCYAEEIDHLSSSELAETLFLDGCFILELFLRYSKIEPNLKHGDLQNDPIFTTSWIITTLQRDMMLLENQIPFFVLEWLFDHTVRRSGLYSIPLSDIALRFFESTVSGSLMMTTRTETQTQTLTNSSVSIRMSSRQSTKHLLHLIHISYMPSNLRSEGRRKKKTEQKASGFVPSVEELIAAGIKIQKSTATSMFELELKGLTLRIPQLRIVDSTDDLFRNLVAFEQCFHGCPQYVTSYAVVMNQLIYTPKDVELLEQHEIVENCLRSREDVSYMFFNICKQIGMQEFYFAGMCEELNGFCDRPWIKTKVALKRDYFTSPWTLISLLAVVSIVTMAVVQTVYTVLSYYHNKK